MTDRQAFLNAIIDRPDDDLVRLVFADFLDENGDPDRAEFVRAQIDLARLPDGHEDAPALRERADELLAAHDWRIPDLRGKQDFRRGFVEVVLTDAAWLLDVPAARFDETPVRDLQVRNAAGHIPQLAAIPWLWRVEHLDMRNAHLGTGDRLARFFAAARVDRLTSLSVRNCVLWAEELEVLASSPVCRRLTALDVSGNPITEAGAAVLATNASFAGLETLIARTDDLQFADCFHAEAMEFFAASTTLTKLRVLDLRGHHIGDAGFISLVSSPNVAKLQALDVGFNDIGDTGDSAVEALVRSPHLGELRILRLNGSAIDRLWADALVGWDRLEQMELIDVRRARFGTGARERLEQSPWAAKFLFE